MSRKNLALPSHLKVMDKLAKISKLKEEVTGGKQLENNEREMISKKRRKRRSSRRFNRAEFRPCTDFRDAKHHQSKGSLTLWDHEMADSRWL